jgi:hypothetical protein
VNWSEVVTGQVFSELVRSGDWSEVVTGQVFTGQLFTG